MEISHARTRNKVLTITLNGPLYKNVEETFNVTFFTFTSLELRFMIRQATLAHRVQLLAPGETDFWIQYFRRTLCAPNKGGEQGEKCTSWRHSIWTLFWLRAVGTEADICEVVKISQIMRQGDKQAPEMIHPCPPPTPRYSASMWLHDTNNPTWLMRTMKTGPDACGIRPFSRLRIFMPRCVSCRRRLLRWHECRRTRMHRGSYKPRLGEGWKSFLPCCNWTAAMRHRRQVEAHSSGKLSK